MSITDELRKYANELDRMAAMKSEHGFSPVGMRLERIADSIDEEHERLSREQYNDGYNEGYASADDWDADHAEELTEHGWVELPKDADGKPIRIGDVVIYDHDGVRKGTPETVKWIAMGETEVHITTDGTSYSMPSSLRHVERPTVESTLRELVAQVSPDAEWERELILDYADRIRKAVGHE